ncbi:MAG: hypothetical protein A3F43_05070 [Gammaproteobacteria bacterium RIFCSPHIGHO2_12_FULL_42_10]|nr:MAG: hypothetical protein A3F43_05070 [Gammaproteobacteria bacterium RIFCSPHIGHO2_12_FULL_42_10]
MDKKALSLPILIAMVVGNMIGAGIFVLPASLASFGTISIFSWILTSCGALLLALTFAHLNRRYSKTGGPYVYTKQAFGNLSGFIVAFIYWFSQSGSVAGIAVASIGYLGYVFPSLNANAPYFNPNNSLIAELAMVWGFTLINIVGIHFAGVVQLLLTIIKMTPLFAVILFGATSMHWINLTHFTTSATQSPFMALTSAAAITFWAFVGLEAATVPAENTRGPHDITIATIVGTLISAIVYIASTVVLMGMIPVHQLMASQFPFAEAGAMLFGPFGALFIAIFACVSGMTALNVSIFLQGQIMFSAARDRIFPAWFSKLSKHDVPTRAILLSSIISTLLLTLTVRPTLLQQFDFIILATALLSLIVYLVSACAEIKFSIQQDGKLKRTLTQSSTLIALIAACYSILMIVSMNIITIKIGVAVILACVPIYYFFVQRYMRTE